MDYKSAVREFERSHRILYLSHVDYWTAQYAWSIFTDNLCKAGFITQKQYNTWKTPFPESKPLKPKPYMTKGVIYV